MRTYTELYEYDAVGNFEKLIHQAANGSWTREYAYNEASLIEPATKRNNRLSRTTIHPNGNQPIPEPYTHDAHGNMTRMPQLQVMEWDFKDQLQMTQRQAVDAFDVEGIGRQGERTYYVYDAGGQRVRKVTERQNGTRKDKRIYLGGFEIYRRQGVNAVVRETLHIMDDTQRIALVENRTQGNEGSPPQLIRYQFGNHLGSAALELDDQAQIISYEEYYSYGSTAYQAVRSQTETPKRYRYTGKERDEENGFYYHGARYYAPWLGRWITSDPAGFVDGINLYVYARNHPLKYGDPTGMQCDPAVQSCVDPTVPTPREETFQQSLPEDVRHLPPGDLPPGERDYTGPAIGPDIKHDSRPLTPIEHAWGSLQIEREANITERGERKYSQTDREYHYRTHRALRRAERLWNLFPPVGPTPSTTHEINEIIEKVNALPPVTTEQELLWDLEAAGIESKTPLEDFMITSSLVIGGVGSALKTPYALFDTNVLVHAMRGHQKALAALRSSRPVITTNQLREFLAVRPSERLARLQFLAEQRVSLFTDATVRGSQAYREAYELLVNEMGYSDAALAGISRATGYKIYTAESRLPKRLILTPDGAALEIDISRIGP